LPEITKLITVIETKADFIDDFSSQVVKFTQHSLTTKAQNRYMKELKSSRRHSKFPLGKQASYATSFCGLSWVSRWNLWTW